MRSATTAKYTYEIKKKRSIDKYFQRQIRNTVFKLNAPNNTKKQLGDTKVGFGTYLLLTAHTEQEYEGQWRR